MDVRKLREKVALSLSTALVLEVSASPKAGLVDRYRGFIEVSYLDFVKTALAVKDLFADAAELAIRNGVRGGVVGRLLENAVEVMLEVQRGGNTLLGAMMLLFPIAYAAGYELRNERKLTVRRLRRALCYVIKNLDWKDASSYFQAIAKTSPGGLGRVPFLDVKDTLTYEEIKKRKARLVDVFSAYKGRDMIADEITSCYMLTFEVCLPALTRWKAKLGSLELSSVNSLLEVMASRPDTHIEKRSGPKRARIVMGMAKQVLALGGIATERGRKSLMELDEYLRRNDLRPGASADVLDAGLAVYLLCSE